MKPLLPDRRFASLDLPQAAPIEVNVIYTSPQATLTALEAAGRLASDLDARISLLAVHEVPIAFPVGCPPVARSFLERRLLGIVSRGVQGPIETTVKLCLCRHRGRALRELLEPRSLVVLGCSRRWWPRKERQMARRLRAEGHQVILVKYRHGGFDAGPFLSRDRHHFLHSLLGLRQSL